MALFWSVVHLLLWLFFIALIGRLVLEWVQVFSRSWRPQGVMLVLAEALFSVTDPAVKGLRRLIPPVRMGGVSLDLSMLVLLLGVSFLMSMTASLST
jgi:YggT family protein